MLKMSVISISITIALLMVQIMTVTGCYTEYHIDSAIRGGLMNQRRFQSYDACKEWCSAHDNCKAAVVSPSTWAYRECFLVSSSYLETRSGWYTALKKSSCDSGCYTEYKTNSAIRGGLMNQRRFQSYDACKEWCREHDNCKAAVVSPWYWAYRECFLVSSSYLETRSGWYTALKKSSCDSDTNTCDCNSMSDQDFELSDVEYEVDRGLITVLPPKHAAIKIVRNRSSQKQMIKFVASKAVTETRSFQYTGGFSVKVGTTFEVGIPVIAQAGISLEVSTTHEFTTGKVDSETKTLTSEFWCNAAPHKVTKCEAVVFRKKLEVPYTMIWTKKSDSTCQCKQYGVFSGISGHQLEMTASERDHSRRK